MAKPPQTSEPAKSSARRKRSAPSYGKQLLVSLLAAVAITVLTIAIVTAKIGPGPDWEEQYDTRSERRDLIQERNEARQDRIDQRQDNSGSG